jgi:hypothetical protein
MPQQKPKPSTATQRANEALDRAAPEGKSPARKTLAFLLEGSHDPQTVPATESSQPRNNTLIADSGQYQSRTAPLPVPEPFQTSTRPVPNTAPDRDFNKRANSLEREALPAGVFPGSSKKIYDALYFRTRGAVKPVRTIQATRRDLMQWTGIRNVKTIHDHTRRLATAGLIGVVKLDGDHEGSVYEVFLPEESDRYQSLTSTAPVPVLNRNSVADPYQKTVRDGMGKPVDSQATYAESKTSFKTNTERSDDDDAGARTLVEPIQKAIKAATGRELTATDYQALKDLGEIIATEFQIAAARTTVNSPGSFLAEHMRRRLFKKGKTDMAAEAGDIPVSGVKALASEELAKCPDCGGSGWWYPEGESKGVAKCKHENLMVKS